MKQNNTEIRQNTRQVQENRDRRFASRHGKGYRLSLCRGFCSYSAQYQGGSYMDQNPVAGIDPSILPNPFMTEQRLIPEHELELLRQQAGYIESDLQRIQQRINELSQNAD